MRGFTAPMHTRCATHNLWLDDFHRAGDTGLARYFDLGEGPVPEQEDDSTYYPDVIRWLLAHPEVHTDYLVDGPEQPNAVSRAELAKTSCDISISHVCAHAACGWPLALGGLLSRRPRDARIRV